MKAAVPRQQPTRRTTLLLLRRGQRVWHVVVGSALMDAHAAAHWSLFVPEGDIPALVDLFCDTPEQAHRNFVELCELGDFDPDPEDFKQEWFPPAAGLAAMNWLLLKAARPRSKTRALLSPAARHEIQLIQFVLGEAARRGLKFHLVNVRARESRGFAGTEILARPENKELEPTRSTQLAVGPRGSIQCCADAREG